MHKSSVYLPEELKQRLADVATRRGRSEADLIRSAIEHLVRADAIADVPEPRPPSFARPSVVGVGMGPGDPMLVTMAARAVLTAADRVVVVTTDTHSVGRAEMIVRAVAPSAPVTRVPFAIGSDDAGRGASLCDVVAAAVAGIDAGELVAIALLGDPALWTIFPAVARETMRARPGVHVSGIAGVTTFQAVAAKANAALGAPGSPLVIVDNVVDLAEFLARSDNTVVLFKASTDAHTIQDLAAGHGRGGFVAELTGLPGERITPLAQLPSGPISYLATVVFPASIPDRAAAS